MDAYTTLSETIINLRMTLEQMAQWGCTGFECPKETLKILKGWAKKPGQKKSCSKEVPDKGGGNASISLPTIDIVESLEDIRSDIGQCDRCGLASGRTHIVFGEGAPKARLVFVGEGPGFDEDRTGRPFVGVEGQLLTRIVQAMKLSREEVYICNVIKCRPPENRDPKPEEIVACGVFLQRQLSAIAPEVICTLGSHAAQTLLNTNAPISKLRGRFYNYNEIKLMPTYHPAFLLRNPERKRDVWEDIKKIMALLRIPL